MALPRLQPLVLAWAALLVACASARGAEASPVDLHLSDEDGVVELGSKLEILRDPSGKLSIEDVLSPAHADAFAPSQEEVPSFGFTPDAVWVRFTMRAEASQPELYMLELAMSRLSHFDWYVVQDGQVTQRLAQGSADLASRTHRASRFPLLTLALRRGQAATVYARAQSDTSVWLPFTASTPPTHLEHALRRDWIDFMLFGICVALLLISLSLGFIFHRRIYFLAALMPPCYLVYQAIFGGHYLMLDINWPDWVGRKGMLLVVAGFIAGLVLFMDEFFADPERKASRIPALRAAKALLALAILCILALPYGLAAQASQAAFILTLLCICWLAIAETRRKPTAENLILVAGGLTPLVGTTILLAQWTAAMPMIIDPAQALRAVLPAAFVLFLLACARSQRTLLEVESQLAGAHRAETEARLEALRHQLNPHFSYNALASIDALSREAPDRIPELVSRLGAFLRHRMAPSGQPLNPLGNELEATRAYLDVEHVRLENRLEVTYEVDSAARRALVPEFCLQPLAENALKYGLAEASSVRIRIIAQVKDGRLRLAVANTGRIQTGHVLRRGASIGLGNLRRRLALHHGADARVELSEADGWVTAALDIPFREHSEP